MQYGDEAKNLLRPMPVTLRGVVTENDFESFCDRVDLLLQKYHVLQSTFHTRMSCLSFTFFITFIIVFILIFTVPDGSPVQIYLLIFMGGLMGTFVPLIFSLACKFMWDGRALRDKIQMECEKMTNRTVLATFQLMMKEEKKEHEENSHWELSHVDVYLSETV